MPTQATIHTGGDACGHKNSRVTASRSSSGSSSVVCKRCAVGDRSWNAVRCRHLRTAFHDWSHTAQRLQTTLLLPLDDLLAVTREFLCPQASPPVWIVACVGMA